MDMGELRRRVGVVSEATDRVVRRMGWDECEVSAAVTAALRVFLAEWDQGRPAISSARAVAEGVRFGRLYRRMRAVERGIEEGSVVRFPLREKRAKQ